MTPGQSPFNGIIAMIAMSTIVAWIFVFNGVNSERISWKTGFACASVFTVVALIFALIAAANIH